MEFLLFEKKSLFIAELQKSYLRRENKKKSYLRDCRFHILIKFENKSPSIAELQKSYLRRENLKILLKRLQVPPFEIFSQWHLIVINVMLHTL